MTRFPAPAIAIAALLMVVAGPAAVEASYTSTVSGSTATMAGDAASDTLIITQSGGLFRHNRPLSEGFASDSDFDTTSAGDQAVASATGIINIDAGDGNDTIALSDGVDLRGTVNGGVGTDVLDYSGRSTAVRVNLGLRITGLSGTLGADQENPATTHAGTGQAIVSNYNVAARTFSISVQVSDLPPGDVIGFHIHQERTGVNGPIIVDFTGVAPLVPSGTGLTFNASGLILPAGSEAAFFGGGTYVNIHTPAFPGGAIRGQLLSNGSAATGGVATGTTGVSNIENVVGGGAGDSIVGTSSENGLSGNSGDDWIVGGPGADTLGGDPGADVLGWNDGDGSDIVDGGADDDAVQLNGSVLSAPQFVFQRDGTRLGVQISGIGVNTLSIGTTETVIVNGAPAPDTVIIAPLSGVAFPTTINANGFNGDDEVIYSPAFLAGVATLNAKGGPGNDLINVGGSSPIGVNLGLSTTGLTATLGGDQEQPPTTHAGTGTASVTNYNPGTRTFDITVTVSDLPPGDVVGFHIHQGLPGVNGPIIVNFPSGGDPALVPSGTGFTFTATGLVLPFASEAAFLGGGTYVNIHSPAFPGGAIRGQLFSLGNASVTTQTATSATIAGFERANSGGGDDSLVGNSGVNILNGNFGVDWLLGGPGGDTLNGGSGSDVLIWSNGDGTDIMEGGADADTVQVNGSLASGDAFTVSANGTRVDFDRTNLGLFSLDIGTTETLIVNGIGGADNFTINSLTGVAALSAVNLHGFDGDDVFNVKATATMAPTVRGGLGGADVLNYDAEFRVVSGDTTPPDGQIDSAGAQSTPFIQVEAVNVTTTAPTVTINDVTVGEGFAPTTAVFTVTLSSPSPLTVTVNFATADGTAIAPGDYTSQGGMLTFVPGDTVETISVPINADALAEATEMFVVNLSGAVNTVTTDNQGQGAITDNAGPTISAIANQTVDEDTATVALPFTVNDAEVPAASLTLSGGSTNLTLVPVANITFGGSGASRTVTVTPAPNQNGSAIITVTVSDGNVSTSTMFTLTVTATNDAPTITPIANQAIAANSSTGPLPFTVNDVDVAPASLAVSATSSDPTLVPVANIGFGGAGADRTVTVTPAADRGGVAIITVTVSDGIASANTMLTLTVSAPPPPPPPPSNQPPTLTGLTDRTIDESTSLTLTLTVGDDTTPAASLVVTATSSNAALVPASGVALGGSGSTRTLTLTPVADATGQTTLTVNVSDGELTTTATAVLTVVALSPPQPPTNLTGSALGTEVTLTWVEPVTGSTPSFYVIEVGTAPGLTTLPVIVTPSRTTGWTLQLPAGVYFFRVRAANRVGTSNPSNEATVVVTSAVPLPGSPTGLAAIVEGAHVMVSWQRATVGGPPDNWQLELGSSRGGTDRGVFALPGAVTSAAGDLPAGEYFARVRGVNSAGPGPASNEASFRVGEVPACDAPRAPVLLPATIVGPTVTFSWQAPGPPAVGTYRLLVGSTPGGSDLAVIDVGPVTSYVVNAPPGRYHVTLLATNTCGTSTPSNPIEVIVAATEPPPAPANMRATVNGQQVTLAWDAVASATSYVLEAGSASGLSNVATLPLTATGLTVDGVPSGTYFLRVRAVRAGVASVPSGEIAVVVP